MGCRNHKARVPTISWVRTSVPGGYVPQQWCTIKSDSDTSFLPRYGLDPCNLEKKDHPVEKEYSKSRIC